MGTQEVSFWRMNCRVVAIWSPKGLMNNLASASPDPVLDLDIRDAHKHLKPSRNGPTPLKIHAG